MSIFWNRIIWKQMLLLINGKKTLNRQNMVKLHLAGVATYLMLKEYCMAAHPQDFGSFENI